MGAVFRARDERSGEEVALKVLKGAGDDPSLLDRFKREGRLLAELDHPGIVGLRGELSVTGGQAYYAMELVEGQDLRQVLRARGALPAEEAIRIAQEVLAALAYAHARDVIHRDVKPPNVLLDGAGRARLADFGLARVLESSGLTRTGTVLGTPEYMAPEQAEGQPSEARTDIYALGVLLYELVSGAPPFRAERPLAVLRAHCEAPVPPLRSPHGLPSGLEGVLRRALAKAPAARWPSALAMAQALDELVLTDLVSPQDETLLEAPLGEAGPTTPLPLPADSGRGSAPTGALPPTALPPEFAQTTLEPPPAGNPETGASPTESTPEEPSPEDESRRPSRLPLMAAASCLGLVALIGGALALNRTPAEPPLPPPSRGLGRDWGTLSSPQSGPAEDVAIQHLEEAAWGAQERGAWAEAAVAWAAASLRTDDMHKQLWARGNAIQAVAAVASPGVVRRKLQEARASALSPAGDLVAQALEAGGIRLTPLVGAPRDLGATPELRLLEFSPDGRYLAAAPWLNSDAPRPIEVWDLESDTLVARLGEKHQTRTLAWIPDGTWLLSGSATPEDGLLLFRPLGDREPIRFPGTDMRIHVQPTWSPDGRRLIFSSARGGSFALSSGLVIGSFDPTSGRYGRTTTIERGHSVNAAAWSPTGSLLALGGEGEPIGQEEWPRSGHASILNLKSGKSFKLSGHERGLVQFSWSPDGSRLVSADGFGLQCWQVAPSGKPTLEGSCQGLIRVRAAGESKDPPLRWSPDSAYVAGSKGGGLAIWSGREPARGRPFLSAIYPPVFGNGVQDFRWKSPGKLSVLTNEELSARPIKPELLATSPGALLDFCEGEAGTSIGELFSK